MVIYGLRHWISMLFAWHAVHTHLDFESFYRYTIRLRSLIFHHEGKNDARFFLFVDSGHQTREGMREKWGGIRAG